MTITVTLFDGTVLKFPDGTTREAIQRMTTGQTAAHPGVTALPGSAVPPGSVLHFDINGNLIP